MRAQHLTLTYSQSVANTFHTFVTFTICNDRCEYETLFKAHSRHLGNHTLNMENHVARTITA